MLAMVAVGLWAGINGGRALWAWPAAFVGVMLAGGALGMAGVPVPLVEPGILASVIVLGLLVLTAARLPVALGAALVARIRPPAWPRPRRRAAERRGSRHLCGGLRAGHGAAARRSASASPIYGRSDSGKLVVRGAGAAVARSRRRAGHRLRRRP